MAVLAAVAQILQPIVIPVVDKARALHIHQEVVDKGFAVTQLQPAVGQGPLMDLGPGRTTTATFWHGIDGVFVLGIRAVAHLQHRRVVTGKEHVTHAIGTAQLGQADTVTGNIGRIATARYPAGELMIEFAITAGHLAGAFQYQSALRAKLAVVGTRTAIDPLHPHQILWQGPVQILLAQIFRHLAVKKASVVGLFFGHFCFVRVARTTGQSQHCGGQPVRVFVHMSSYNAKSHARRGRCQICRGKANDINHLKQDFSKGDPLGYNKVTGCAR